MKTRQFNVRLTDEAFKALLLLGSVLNMKPSEVVRELIRNAFDKVSALDKVKAKKLENSGIRMRNKVLA